MVGFDKYGVIFFKKNSQCYWNLFQVGVGVTVEDLGGGWGGRHFRLSFKVEQ